MTALERQWVESGWWPKQYLGIRWYQRHVGNDVYIEFQYEAGAWWSFLNVEEDIVFGPGAPTADEAKSDAEAMYEAWVYETHGAVLP